MKDALKVVVVAAATLIAAGQASAQPAVRWLIIVDDLHFDFRNTRRVRTLVKTIAAELIHDGEQVALYSTGPSFVSVAWTSDRSEVDRVVKQIAGNALRVSDILATAPDLALTNEVDHRATTALSKVNEVIGLLDPALDRRTGIVYISNGYVDRSPSLTRAGGRARMPVFALDPRLLPGAIVDTDGVDARWNAYWAATRNSLRALSQQSGGFALEEREDLAAALVWINNLVRQ